MNLTSNTRITTYDFIDLVTFGDNKPYVEQWKLLDDSLTILWRDYLYDAEKNCDVRGMSYLMPNDVEVRLFAMAGRTSIHLTRMGAWASWAVASGNQFAMVGHHGMQCTLNEAHIMVRVLTDTLEGGELPEADENLSIV